MDEHTIKHRVRSQMQRYLGKAQAAFLTTLDDAGFPHTRTMVNLRNRQSYPLAAPLFAGHEQDFLTYFSTVRGFEKLRHIRRDARCSVFYCHPREWWSLLLKGTLEVVEDEEIRRHVWHESWSEIFPARHLDPRQVVLRLNPISALGLCNIDHQRYSFELISEDRPGGEA